jgi:hypothetical protein
MRGIVLLLGSLLPLVAACGIEQTVPPVPSNRPAAPAATAAPTPQVDVAREAQRLRAALAREVPQHTIDGAETERAWITRAKGEAGAAHFAITRSQLLVVVDRNPTVQQMRIILARPDGAWEVIGGSKVSTGQAGRHGYYITPVGVFLHTDDVLDYRALGTFDENHIRRLGAKGMRVWDFGWHTAEKGWRDDRETRDIRLLMHATDPDYLERRLGRPASQGCVRTPATMNRFLDMHGVLDLDYERSADQDPRLRSVLLPERQPTPLAGEALIVVDSASPTG